MRDLRHLSVRLPSSLLRELEAIADKRGTLSQTLREAAVAYVERERRAQRRVAQAKREGAAS